MTLISRLHTHAYHWVRVSLLGSGFGAYKRKLRLHTMQHPDVELQLDFFLCCGCVFCMQEPLLFKENLAHLSGGGRFFNSSFQVSACTSVGCGPWSTPVMVLPTSGEQAFGGLMNVPCPEPLSTLQSSSRASGATCGWACCSGCLWPLWWACCCLSLLATEEKTLRLGKNKIGVEH